MKIRNISEGKIIGVGEVTVLPGETKEIPAAYETSPILEVYKKLGLAEIIGKVNKAAVKERADKEAEEKAAAQAAAEELRKERLANIQTMGDDEVAAIAQEYGINPASCKDLADVRKKVKAALTKK